MARNKRIPAEPLQVGEKSTGKSLTVDQTERPVSGAVAQGEALAIVVIRSVKDSLTTGMQMLREIQKLTKEGREKFRAALESHMTSIREQVKTVRADLKSNENDEDLQRQYATLRGAASVWSSRISEYRKFAEAVDAGLSFDPKLGYAKSLTSARLLLAAESTTGPTRRRGRARKDVREKVLKYLNDQLDDKGITEDEVKFVRDMLTRCTEATKAMAHDAEQVKVEL